MKKTLLTGLTTLLFSIGITGIVNATSIVATDSISTTTEIDYWDITLSSTADLSIDASTPSSSLDTYIHLLDNNNQQLAYNDDYNGFDSYLSVNGLAAGDYTLAIGSWSLSLQEVLAGVNSSGYSSGSYQLTFNSTSNMTVTDPGGTRVPSLGEGRESVPEPSAMFFLGTGLVGLVGSRIKKIRKKRTNA